MWQKVNKIFSICKGGGGYFLFVNFEIDIEIKNVLHYLWQKMVMLSNRFLNSLAHFSSFYSKLSAFIILYQCTRTFTVIIKYCENFYKSGSCLLVPTRAHVTCWGRKQSFQYFEAKSQKQ